MTQNLNTDTPNHTIQVLTTEVAALSASVRRKVSREYRNLNSQFFTPMHLAKFMASLMDLNGHSDISILDPCIGTGMLTASVVEMLAISHGFPFKIVAYEIDQYLADESRKIFKKHHDAAFSIKIHNKDFLQEFLSNKSSRTQYFDFIILNPPYKKISSANPLRILLKKHGINEFNMYVAFLEACLYSLKPDGHLIALIPRSFCNGFHYREFRKKLAVGFTITSIHTIGSRESAFREDSVLQENIIISIVNRKSKASDVVSVTCCSGDMRTNLSRYNASISDVISLNESESFLKIITSKYDKILLDKMSSLRSTISSLGFDVSTGKVVDFRLSDGAIQTHNGGQGIPLIYPSCLRGWDVEWPNTNNKGNLSLAKDKYNGLIRENMDLALLIKRFTSKEEKRRLVASVYQKELIGIVGVENHINCITSNSITDKYIFYGLAAFINSKEVNNYYRILSGHTQVNANDLKLMPCPTLYDLKLLGTWIYEHRSEIDPESALSFYSKTIII